MSVKPWLIAMLLALGGIGCGDDDVIGPGDRTEDQIGDRDTPADWLPDVTPSGYHAITAVFPGAGLSSNGRFQVFGGVLASGPSRIDSARFTVFPVIGVRR